MANIVKLSDDAYEHLDGLVNMKAVEKFEKAIDVMLSDWLDEEEFHRDDVFKFLVLIIWNKLNDKLKKENPNFILETIEQLLKSY